MKTCSVCKELLPLTEFNKSRSRKDGLQTKCRSCSRKKSREYYKDNGERMRSQISNTRKHRKADLRQRLFDYLDSNPCVDCGESDPVVLEFDHRDPSDKVINLSTAIARGWSWSRIMSEIRKCDVRCANCHRKKTARDQGWYKMKPDSLSDDVNSHLVP